MGRVPKGDRSAVSDAKSVLAVIPARGDSKRLPRKNIMSLAGKPLVVWTIEAGLRSEYVDKVIVSSEDTEILEISQNAGVETILRPTDLATDEATTYSVIEHAVNKMDQKFEYTLVLQPTSPLRNEKHIDEAFDFLLKKNADAVISVCEAGHNPLWSNMLPKDNSMKNFLKKELLNKRSQDLPVFHQLNGAIYFCKTNKLLEEETFFITDNIFAYKMARMQSIDIDEMYDFLFTEYLLKNHSSDFKF